MNFLSAISFAIICTSLLACLPNFSILQNIQSAPMESSLVRNQFPANIDSVQTLTSRSNAKQAITAMTSSAPVATAEVDTTTYWKNLAQDAWTYFQPGNGVNYVTGLHGAQVNYPYFTDWDLGIYIQAIIDADKIGLDNRVGLDANSRLNKILTFLENRQLMPNGQPYAWYSATTGYIISVKPQDPYDAGNLLLALKNVETYIPSLKARIDNIVYNRTNYEPLAKTTSSLAYSGVYFYYLVSGFAAFWPNTFEWPGKFTTNFQSQASTVLTNIVNAPTIQTYGIALPKTEIICEPILLSLFNLQYQDPRLLDLAKKVYLAHEARSKAIGKYVAYSEGNTGGIVTGPSDADYIYEYVAQPNGRTWILQNADFEEVKISPITYLKVATSFSAIYKTQYAQNMTNYLLSQVHSPLRGFEDGIDQDGRINTWTTDKTNSMIISAARYAIDNPVANPTPTSTPYLTPTPSKTPTPTPLTTPNRSDSPSLSPTTNLTSSPTPSPSAAPPQNPNPSNANVPTPSVSPSDFPFPTPASSPTADSSASPITSKASSPGTNPTVSPTTPDLHTIPPDGRSSSSSNKDLIANPEIITIVTIVFAVVCVCGAFLKLKRRALKQTAP